MPAAICKLAHAQAAKNQSGKTEQVINTMLSQLSLMYSSADDIYLFAHAQNARRYWQWLQDSQFDPDHPPTTKIHLIRIRDGMYHEVPTGYGLPMDSENFEEETASFAGGILFHKPVTSKRHHLLKLYWASLENPELAMHSEGIWVVFKLIHLDVRV